MSAVATEVPSFAWSGGGLSGLKRKATQERVATVPLRPIPEPSFDDLLRGPKQPVSSEIPIITGSIRVPSEVAVSEDDLGDGDDGWVVPMGAWRLGVYL